MISAVAASFSDIFTKEALINVHAMEFRTTFKTLQLPLLLLLIPFVNFHIDAWIYFVILLISSVAVLGGFFMCKAIKHSEISSVMPIKNFSPVFLVILSYFLLGEVLNLRQGIGVLILILGAYVLEVDHKISDLKQPIIKIMKTKAIHFVLLGLFLYSISAIGDKYILNYIDIFTFLFWIWIFMIIISNFISMTFYNGFKDIKYTMKKSGWSVMLVSIFAFVSALAYLKALTLAMVVLVVPIKRLSTLFSTFIGGEIFHDHGLKLKLIACVILIIGSVLVVI